MSAAAVIDTLEFARGGQQLRGSLAVVDLKRLEDILFDTQGTLEYALRGGRDVRNRPQIEVTAEGLLHLQCQRCLGLLEYEADVTNTLVVLPAGAQPDDELDDPEGPDVIESDAELNVAGLIEDEVLLSLPLAPRHPEGTCASRLDNQENAAQKPSPFAQLAELKQPQRRKRGTS